MIGRKTMNVGMGDINAPITIGDRKSSVKNNHGDFLAIGLVINQMATLFRNPDFVSTLVTILLKMRNATIQFPQDPEITVEYLYRGLKQRAIIHRMLGHTVSTNSHSRSDPTKIHRICIPSADKPITGGRYLPKNIKAAEMAIKIHFCKL